MSHDVVDFEKEVIARSHEVPVMCDFWAPWCGPCRMLGPVLEALAARADGRWVLAKLNTDEHPGPAQRFQIRGIPAVKLFHEGEVVAEFTGAQSAATIENWLAQHLPDRSPPVLREAEAASAGLRFSEVEAMLRPEIGRLEGRDRDRGEWLLAKAILWKDPAEALSLLRGAATAGDEREGEAVRTLAGILMTPPALPSEPTENRGHLLAALGELGRGRVDEAMAHLTEVLWDHPRFADGLAVQLQRALILYLGIRHPLSQKHFNAYSGAADSLG